MNRNFDHELKYKNVTDSINKLSSVRKCADYFLIPNSKSKKAEKPGQKDFGTNNVLVNNTNVGEFGGICKVHLHTLLNRDSDANLGDYVYQGCYAKKNKNPAGGNGLNLSNLAGFA